MSEERPASRAGSFRIHYQKGFAMLTVRPPVGGGRPVYAGEVMNRMKMLRIPAVRRLVVDRIVARASGVPEKLVEWPEGARLSAQLEVFVSEDHMMATCVMRPPRKGGSSFTEADVVEELKAAGVVFGFQDQIVGKMIREEIYGEEMTVAVGLPPVAGKAERVEYRFNTSPGKPYLVMDYGRINLKELDFIQNRKTGDVLAEKLPAEPPRPGKTVLGEVLPAPGAEEPRVLSAGSGTQLSEDGSRIIALVDGHARLRDGVVCVEPVVTVENVDYSTGNISFDGSVVVEGTVADGFRVEAGGSIQVDRYVGKAQLAAGDSVLLRSGVNGGGECRVSSDGDILARYIENAHIRCRGNLFVEEAVMHSDVFAGGNVILSGKRAEIFAGSLNAGGSVWCKKLGNVSEARTFVRLGVDPAKVELSSRLARTIEEKQEDLNELDTRLGQMTEQIRSGRHITEEQRTSLRRLRAEIDRRAEELRELEKKHRAIEARMSPDRDALLVAEESVFHGVTLVFGNREYPVPLKGIRKTIFRMSGKEITESGFNPASPPRLDLGR